MPQADVEKQLRNVFAEIFLCESSAIRFDSSPNTIANWNSLQHLNLVLRIEEEFALTIPDEEVIGLTTFGAIVHFIEAARRQSSTDSGQSV